MATPETRNATCKICFKETPVPTGNPPFGSHLICVNCLTPLVGVSAGDAGTPQSVAPELLRRHMGFTGRCLIHPFCPWCQDVNYGVVAPSEGRLTPWTAQKEPSSPKAFALKTACVHCDKEFYVEWDEAPLPADCALCRRKIRPIGRATLDPRFCADCGPKLTQVHERKRKTDPPGTALEYAFLVGFSRTPSSAWIKALQKRDPEIGEAPIAALMVSGGVPASPIEAAMITVDLATTVGRKAVQHEINLSKVSYQNFRSYLVIKLWV